MERHPLVVASPTEWRVWCLWDIAPKCEEVQPLDVAHVAVRDAASTLAKPIVAS